MTTIVDTHSSLFSSARSRAAAVPPLGLAAGSGLLYGLALAPDAPPALAWVALAPLFVACGIARPALAALCGLVFAVVATALLASWFPATLQRFFGASAPGSWLGWLGLAALVNAPPYILLCGWLAWRGQRRPVAPLLVGAAWLVAEWLRAHGPVPNPYALLATSQLGTAFAQSADALGAFGLGAIVASGNATLAALASPRLLPPRPLRPLALAIAALLAVYAYGSWRASLPHADGPALRVAAVQPATAGDRTDPAELLALTERVQAGSGGDAPGLVFWPEAAVDFPLREASALRDRVLASTRTRGVELVLGAPHYRYAEPQPDHFASAFLVREGRVAGRYDKRRLVPFAEYDPLGGWLPAAAPLRSGDGARLLPGRNASIGVFLCGEVLFPDVARELSRAGATLLSNPSKDDWFGAEAPARHQLRAAAFRAIENRRPLVRATSGGYSAVLDARGRIVVRGEFGAAGVLEATVHPSTGTTAYQRAGSAIPLGAAGLVLAASLPRRRQRESGGKRP